MTLRRSGMCSPDVLRLEPESAPHLAFIVQLGWRQARAAGRCRVDDVHQQRRGGCAVKGQRRNSAADLAAQVVQEGEQRSEG